MPAAVFEAAAGEGGVVAVADADPVAGVRRVAVATVAVVGDERIADEVVARQQRAAVGRAAEVGMLEAHPGVEHRDHGAGAAAGARPRRFDVDGAADHRVGGAQIPLAAVGTARPGAVRQRGYSGSTVRRAGACDRGAPPIRRRGRRPARAPAPPGRRSVGGDDLRALADRRAARSARPVRAPSAVARPCSSAATPPAIGRSGRLRRLARVADRSLKRTMTSALGGPAAGGAGCAAIVPQTINARVARSRINKGSNVMRPV